MERETDVTKAYVVNKKCMTVFRLTFDVSLTPVHVHIHYDKEAFTFPFKMYHTCSYACLRLHFVSSNQIQYTHAVTLTTLDNILVYSLVEIHSVIVYR